MGSSDEEGEFSPDYVTNYEFVDARDQLISFSSLPLSTLPNKVASGLNLRNYLHGTTIDGVAQIYKQISAWKYSLSSPQPEIFVLCKAGHWIRLLKPTKRFENIITSTLVTVHFLYYLKQNPQAPEESMWSYLSKEFSSYDVQPCQRNILDHNEMVRDAFRSDMDLQESEYMCVLLEEQSKKRKLLENTMDIQPVDKPSLVVDEASYTGSHNLSEEEDPEEEDPEEEDPEEDDPEEEDPEEEDPEEEVESLERLDLLTEKEEVKEAEVLDFVDGVQQEEKLGEGRNIDEEEPEQDVEEEEDEEELQLFDTCCAICDNGGDILCCEGPCMRSFHATRDDEESNCRSLGLSQAQVNAMTVFYCKNCQYKKHQCSVCMKLGSSDTDSGAEVFLCVSAACGRFYHAQCVGKTLHPENTTQARIVEAQVAAGEMFTCPVHKCSVCGHSEERDVHALQFAICRRCPKAYHRKCLPRNISFVADPERNILQRAWDGLLPNRILIYCRDHKIIRGLGTPSRDHVVFFENSMLKNKNVAVEAATDRTILKTIGQNAAKLNPFEGSPSKKLSQMNNRRQIVFGLKAKKDVFRKTQFVEGSSKFDGMFRYKEACHSSISKGIKPFTNFKTSLKNTGTNKPVVLEKSLAWDIDQSEIERSVNSLIEEVNSSFSMNDIKSHQRAVTFYNGLRESVDKSITMGKVEATVKAVHTALAKLDNGCSIEDAMKICGPEMIGQLHRWKNKLQVHLGPFLHGARYTSYGRHFTKLEKLEKIVDLLHWYAEDGDTIVDFSCGSNDFSWLMSKKLESSGKKCFFKNFDIIQPKNDFNFEKKDWFSVCEEELAIGSRLIIGLNPPFGFKAKLANQFIDKALQFKPKLVILIVSRDTQRLDQKRPPYGLIWEDAHLLAGKSFYLPGSVDVNNKKLEQWNNVSPTLSLWSRPDWSSKHRQIAITCNHLPQQQEQPISYHPMEAMNVPEQAQHHNHMMPGKQPQSSSMLQNVTQHYSHMLNTQPQSSMLRSTQPQYYNPMPGTKPQVSTNDGKL